MITLRNKRVAGLMAMLVVGAGIPEIPLRLLEHAYAADDVVEGFFPALCAGDMPPAELLALGEPLPSPVPSTVAGRDHDLEPVPQALAEGRPPEGEKMLFSGLLVDDDTLGGLRGGFETPGGLVLSFGIERVVLINGVLSSTTTLNVADLSQLAGGAAGPQGLPVGTSVGVIQIGANNSFDPAVLASGSFATVIQNSLDNQKIQTVTTINAQANSMDLLRAHRLGESLRDALNSSLLR